MLAATPSETYWINDCGSKALLAQRLIDSSYRNPDFTYPAGFVDPHRVAFPIPPPFAVDRGDGFVSVAPPAYSALAAPFGAAFGPIGLRIPAALGVAACAALFCAWTVPILGVRWATAGALALGLGTPLFFYGATVWEHSVTAALCLGAWVLVARDSAVRAFVAGALVASACWFREEIALMGLALAFACVLRRRSPIPAVWMALGATGPAIALLALNGLAYGTIWGPHLSAGLDPEALAAWMPGGSRIGVLLVLALLLGGATSRVAEVVLVATVLGTCAAGWLGARLRAAPELVVGAAAGLGLAAWAWGLGQMLTSEEPLSALVVNNGLLIQMPHVSLAGIGLARIAESPDFETTRPGVLAGCVFLVGVVGFGLLTGYGTQAGFGVHWGPRLLVPALPALVLLSLAAVRGSAGTARIAWAALVAAGLLSSSLSVWYLHQQKSDARRFQDAMLAQSPRLTVTAHPLLAQHLSGLWERKPMLHVPDESTLAVVLLGMRAHRVREFLWVDSIGAPLPKPLLTRACRSVHRQRGRHLHYFDLEIHECALRSPR